MKEERKLFEDGFIELVYDENGILEHANIVYDAHYTRIELTRHYETVNIMMETSNSDIRDLVVAFTLKFKNNKVPWFADRKDEYNAFGAVKPIVQLISGYLSNLINFNKNPE